MGCRRNKVKHAGFVSPHVLNYLRQYRKMSNFSQWVVPGVAVVVRPTLVLRKCILCGGEWWCAGRGGGRGRAGAAAAEPEVGRAGLLPWDSAAGTALHTNILQTFLKFHWNEYFIMSEITYSINYNKFLNCPIFISPFSEKMPLIGNIPCQFNPKHYVSYAVNLDGQQCSLCWSGGGRCLGRHVAN